MQQVTGARMGEVFYEYWSLIETEFFKLETLQEYNTRGEEESIRAYKEGRIDDLRDILRKRLVSLSSELYGNVKRNGGRIIRLRLVDLPLTDYIKRQIESYKILEELGEEIFIMTLDDAKMILGEKKDNIQDFLMFDEKRMIVNVFNDNRERTHSLISEDILEIQPFVATKHLLLPKAVPFREFFSKHNS